MPFAWIGIGVRGPQSKRHTKKDYTKNNYFFLSACSPGIDLSK